MFTCWLYMVCVHGVYSVCGFTVFDIVPLRCVVTLCVYSGCVTCCCVTCVRVCLHYVSTVWGCVAMLHGGFTRGVFMVVLHGVFPLCYTWCVYIVRLHVVFIWCAYTVCVQGVLQGVAASRVCIVCV